MMNNSGTIIWKEQEIGTVADIVMDMWYLDANWQPNLSGTAVDFMKLTSSFNPDEIIRKPEKGLVVTLRYCEDPCKEDYYLVLSTDRTRIFMRLINDETASLLQSESTNTHKFDKPWWKFW
ncbi:MAG TPA: hypothetical protein VK173_07575 [Lacibacter sp.]|nr:hypothetical protein [Lacibacter sp.]